MYRFCRFAIFAAVLATISAGATVYAGRRGIASAIGRQAWMYAIVLFVFGLVFPGVDNWAHLGGFLGGYGVARWLDPFKPERTDHLIAALACLLATVAAVVASVTWFDQGRPWAVFRVEEIVYNVDVDAYIRARGL